MNITHNELFLEIIIWALTQSSVLVIIIYQHRLMWREYKRRHKINGGGDD